jgi:DsbC/DsbD-like thiol-disulfide interchange protein
MESQRARLLFGGGIALAGALIVFLTVGWPQRTQPQPKDSSVGPPISGDDNAMGASDIPVADPSRAQPVTAAMAVSKKELHAGDTFELCARVRIAGGHHIYGTNATHGPFIPTALTLSLPREVESMDRWSAPKPTEAKGGDLIYTESVVFRRHLKIQPSAKPGKLKLSGELLCQPCSEELCWPPRMIPLSVSVTVQAPKTE